MNADKILLRLKRPSIDFAQFFSTQNAASASEQFVEIAEVVGQAALETSIQIDERNKKNSEVIQSLGALVRTTGALATNLSGIKVDETVQNQLKNKIATLPYKDKLQGTAQNMTKKFIRLKNVLPERDTIKSVITSPGKLSEIEKNDPLHATSNLLVKTTIISGVILLTIGLVVMFFVKVSSGIVLMMVGGSIVILSVFLPVGAKIP